MPVNGSTVITIKATASMRGLLIANITIADASRNRTTARSWLNRSPRTGGGVIDWVNWIPSAKGDQFIIDRCQTFHQKRNIDLSSRVVKRRNCETSGVGHSKISYAPPTGATSGPGDFAASDEAPDVVRKRSQSPNTKTIISAKRKRT